jgi:hypothetical protein
MKIKGMVEQCLVRGPLNGKIYEGKVKYSESLNGKKMRE